MRACGWRATLERVLEASASGTEPDPRATSAAGRRAQGAILARLMGWRLEMAGVAVGRLYPPEMASLTVDEFLAALPSLDAPFAAKKCAARRGGRGAALRRGDRRRRAQGLARLGERRHAARRLAGTDNDK